jgi:hypothetical protein
VDLDVDVVVDLDGNGNVDLHGDVPLQRVHVVQHRRPADGLEIRLGDEPVETISMIATTALLPPAGCMKSSTPYPGSADRMGSYPSFRLNPRKRYGEGWPGMSVYFPPNVYAKPGVP